MSADTPQPGEDRDPRDGTAAVQPVTEAMMDHAAHEAAALADGVARHGIEAGRVAEAGMVEGAGAVAGTAERAADAAAGAAREVVEAAGAAVDDAADAVADRAGRAAEQARDNLSASADALTRYNAKVLEVLRDGAASTTALFAALIQAKSVPEALAINADHARRRMEALTAQGRELANLAQTVVLDALQPPGGRPDR